MKGEVLQWDSKLTSKSHRKQRCCRLLTSRQKAGIDDKYLEQYGKYKAKIDYNLLKEKPAENGKLILVTAINPTPAGEGKDYHIRRPGRRYAEDWQEGYGSPS